MNERIEVIACIFVRRIARCSVLPNSKSTAEMDPFKCFVPTLAAAPAGSKSQYSYSSGADAANLLPYA